MASAGSLSDDNRGLVFVLSVFPALGGGSSLAL